MKKRFPFLLNRKNAKKIIEIACDEWKKILIDKWSAPLLLDDSVKISEDFYKKMRKACNSEQHELLDQIFGKELEEIDLSRPSTFDNLELFKPNGNSKYSLLAIRSFSEYKNKAFYLNSNFNWEIKEDNSGSLCLIPTKKTI